MVAHYQTVKCLTKTNLAPWCQLEAPIKMILLPLGGATFFPFCFTNCCGIFIFITASLLSVVSNIALVTSGMSFNLKDFIAHPSKKGLDSLLKPQLRQVV